MNKLLLNKLISIFKSEENLYRMSQSPFLFKEILIDNNIILNQKILNQMLNSKFKENVNKKFENLKKNDIGFICNGINEICIITYGNKELMNNKNKILIYKNINSTKHSNLVCNIFDNYLKSINAIRVKIITSVDDLNDNGNENKCIFIIDSLYIKFISKKSTKNNLYIIVNKNKNKFCILSEIIDKILIIEASLNKHIVNLCNDLLDFGKDVLVVPNNIYNKNSYFSNYLIKQGCDVILNKFDLKYYLD